MPAKALRILAVGPPNLSTDAVLERLLFRGWGSYAVESLAEAKSVLRTIRFAIVLAAEELRDGRGYDLSEDVASRDATLLVCVSLSISCLWLPVVVDGTRTLGQFAINEHLLEQELVLLLSGAAKRTAAQQESVLAKAIGKREIPPRRREPAAASAAAAGDARTLVPGNSESPGIAAPRLLKGTAKSPEAPARARASKWPL
ncbi:MAG TPA: hypothetical protein VJR23_05180 [Candidatus Acidoferrales bacterium]|nr:hypothetical protein [Candidatus Acidoferrales bacterium]